MPKDESQMRLLVVVLAGFLALIGIALVPDEGAAQFGILAGPTRTSADGLIHVAALDLPILDVRFGGRLLIVSADSHAMGRLEPDDLRQLLPPDMFVLKASGVTCASLQNPRGR